MKYDAFVESSAHDLIKVKTLMLKMLKLSHLIVCSTMHIRFNPGPQKHNATYVFDVYAL